jgi:apolipoprotein D and lipocalin family protein
MSYFRTLFALLGFITMTGCTGMPDNVAPVSPFNLDRYLGTWYEVARLDHSFEEGLTEVTATYTMNKDGSVKVINRGFNAETNSWKEAEGKAKFVGESDTAHLKVSFFGPFYGSYIVFYLEPDYSSALISSYNNEYFWILSRQPTLSETTLANYTQRAQQAGFDTSKLIYPQRITSQ